MRLKLPESYRIHPVFHVSLLRPVVPDRFPHRSIEDAPGPVEVQGEEEYEIGNILDSRWHYRSLQYLVAWKGYGPEENTWVPAREVHANELIRTFHQNHPLKPSPASVPALRGVPRTTPPQSNSQPTASQPRQRGRPRKTSRLSTSPPAVPRTPVPRPRGRPRKSPLPSSSASVGSDPPVPRPRGRPRKDSLPPSQPTLDSSPPVPRPRGRPRKTSLPPDPTSSDQSVPDSQPGPSPLPQRPPRGRPRKSPPD